MPKTSVRNPASPSPENRQQKKHPRNSPSANTKRTSENRQAQCHTRDDEATLMFPWFLPLLVVATLVVRVLYVLNPRNWWMVHPDEVYQSVEVAHIETSGYGFRTYDFSPPESPGDNITRYRQMEIRAGMAALRSFLFPVYYVLVSKIASFVGWEGNPYVLWRVAHVVVSSLLPLSVHRCVVKLYGSRDKACVSAILVAASTHLNVLGTHCLLHSFLAPFTFLALSMLADVSSCDSQQMIVSQDSYSLGAESCSGETGPCDELNNMKDNSIKTAAQKTNKRTTKGLTTMKTKSPNGVHGRHSYRGNQRETITVGSDLKQNIATAYVSRQNCVEATVAALIITLTCYVRPDVLLIYITSFVVFPELRQFLVLSNLINLLLGASGALAIGIGTDFCYYGWGVYSCLNWLNFNVISGFSDRIFGEMNWWFYIEKLFLHNYGVTMLLFIVILVRSVQIIKTQKEGRPTEHIYNNKYENMTQTLNHRTGLRSSTMWVVLFIVYSLNKHKETRFIHDTVVLMFISIANILVNIKLHSRQKTKCRNFIRVILVVFALTQYKSFPANSKNLDWIYHRTEFVNDVNECIKHISEQKDVTGVFYDSNLYMTGGLSLLHHDVPVLSFLERGFYEFGPQSRRNYTHKSMTFANAADHVMGNVEIEKSINEFNRASNYIAVDNAPAVFRVIIRNPAYNYLVLRLDRKFVDFGFKEVYAVGNSRVLKRLLDVESEYLLESLIDRISPGNNATILLHEGDVLFHMNRYLEASERFYMAVTMDRMLLDAYLPLQISYSKLGNERAARAVHGQCVSLFDAVACTTPRKITRV